MLKTTAVALVSFTVPFGALAGSYGAAPAEPYIEPYVETYTAPEPDSDWEGFYFGVTGGIEAGGHLDYYNGGVLVPPAIPLEGKLYGGFAGYNYTFNNFVAGAEVAYQMGDVHETSTGLDHIENVFDAKARLGYSFGKAMAYGFGGFSAGHWVENTDPGPVPVSGFNVGAGIDMMLGGNFLLGADLTYRSLEGDLDPAGLFPTWSVDAKPIMAGLRLGYKF